MSGFDDEADGVDRDPDDLLSIPRTGPRHEPRDMLDKMLGDSDTIEAGQPTMGKLPEPQYMPVNCATMECLRGPCRFYWAITARMGDYNIGDEIQLKRIYQCNGHTEPTDLNEQNIFQCSLWWPLSLSWVPESFRPALRPRLRKLWEWWMRHRGYDFSWRTWPDDVFEADDPTRRKSTGPGAPSPVEKRAAFRGEQPVGRKVDGGIMFNS